MAESRPWLSPCDLSPDYFQNQNGKIIVNCDACDDGGGGPTPSTEPWVLVQTTDPNSTSPVQSPGMKGQIIFVIDINSGGVGISQGYVAIQTIADDGIDTWAQFT